MPVKKAVTLGTVAVRFSPARVGRGVLPSDGGDDGSNDGMDEGVAVGVPVALVGAGVAGMDGVTEGTSEGAKGVGVGGAEAGGTVGRRVGSPVATTGDAVVGAGVVGRMVVGAAVLGRRVGRRVGRSVEGATGCVVGTTFTAIGAKVGSTVNPATDGPLVGSGDDPMGAATGAKVVLVVLVVLVVFVKLPIGATVGALDCAWQQCGLESKSVDNATTSQRLRNKDARCNMVVIEVSAAQHGRSRSKDTALARPRTLCGRRCAAFLAGLWSPNARRSSFLYAGRAFA